MDLLQSCEVIFDGLKLVPVQVSQFNFLIKVLEFNRLLLHSQVVSILWIWAQFILAKLHDLLSLAPLKRLDLLTQLLRKLER